MLTFLFIFLSYNFCFLILLDSPRRDEIDGQSVKAPYLEDCRVFLTNWAKSVLSDDYIILRGGVPRYAVFNPDGVLEFYRSGSSSIFYEVNCACHPENQYFNPFDAYELDDEAPPSYDEEDMNGESPPYDINLRACSRIMNLMNFTHHIKYRPSSNHGDADYFCYKIMPLKKFPFKVETPPEYKDSRIRTSLFHIDTQKGPVFKSPTLSDFEWMKRKRKGYINDNSLFPSHLLDFWSNPWHV